jgi:hypothetical protein
VKDFYIPSSQRASGTHGVGRVAHLLFGVEAEAALLAAGLVEEERADSLPDLGFPDLVSGDGWVSMDDEEAYARAFRVELVWDAAGDAATGEERSTAERDERAAVRAFRAELGWDAPGAAVTGVEPSAVERDVRVAQEEQATEADARYADMASGLEVSVAPEEDVEDDCPGLEDKFTYTGAVSVEPGLTELTAPGGDECDGQPGSLEEEYEIRDEMTWDEVGNAVTITHAGWREGPAEAAAQGRTWRYARPARTETRRSRSASARGAQTSGSRRSCPAQQTNRCPSWTCTRRLASRSRATSS